MKTIDRYEGCLPEIADALRAGLIIQDVWVWDEHHEAVLKRTIVDYSYGASCPYITPFGSWPNASLTDPRIPAKPVWTYPDAGPDTPIDTPVWCRDSRGGVWYTRYTDGKGGAFYDGYTSFTGNLSTRWKQMVLADPDNLRVPPPEGR